MTPSPREPSTDQPNPSPGAFAEGSGPVLGDFELRRELGRGGMGTVYEAWQRSLQRVVALKVLNGQVGSSRLAVQRFQREAQAAAKLHHTHIVPIFAQGEERGTYFYAMELVDGPSLNVVLADERERIHGKSDSKPLVETIALPRSGSQTGESTPTKSSSWNPEVDSNASTVMVSYSASTADAERRFAVIAEQIANVADALEYAHARGVVHRDIKPHNLMLGSDGRIRVADFGLARLAEQTAVTITGEMLGSPMYMSPEQIIEGPSRVDARTDIYSLGVTLYEWMTLKPAFPGETREGVVSMIVHAEPIAPRVHNPSIPVDLETICMKAMDRDLNRRYRSAAEFRDDLRRYLSRVAIHARRAGLAGRMKKFMARHQFGVLASAAAVMLLVSMFLAVALLRKQSDLEQQTQATEQGKIQAARFLEVLGEAVGGSLPIEGAKMALPVAQGLAKSATEFSASADVPAMLASKTETLETPDQIAKRSLREFYESVHPTIWPPPSSDAARDVMFLLEEALAKRDTDPTNALRMLDLFMKSNLPPQFECVQLHASIVGRLGDVDRMLADAAMLVTIQPQNPIAYVWRGLAQLLNKGSDAALTDFANALNMDGKLHWARCFQGLVLVQQGRGNEAIALFDAALTESPSLVAGLIGRSLAYRDLKMHSKSVADLDQVLKIWPQDAGVLLARGDVHFEAGNYTSALDDFYAVIKGGNKSPTLMAKWMAAYRQQFQNTGTQNLPDLPAGAESARPPPIEPRPKDPQKDSSRRRVWDIFSAWRG